MENKKTPQSQGRQISAQSQAKLILDWSVSCGYCITLKELVAITNVMVDYVETGYTKEIGDRLEKIQEHLDNKPTKSQTL
jgi:hypothetical protein